MSEDREILKEIWEGKLPICFRLSDDECSSSDPEEIYLMVPRQTYFPLVMDKIQRYFSEFVSNSLKNNEVWLDYNGTPLKWNYQVGLLFDLHGNEGIGSSVNIPWLLNVHFENYPSDMLQYTSKDMIEAYFMSTVKEADAIKHKGKIINEMLKKDHKQLWNGVQNDKFDQFWSVNKKLMETSDNEYFKAIPFRIYQNEKAFIQKIFEPFTEMGKKKSLADLLEFVYGSDCYKSKTILIQGIIPSLETSVQWLSENLSYPDNFLHICVK